jgi:hypothetical protein
VFETVEGRYVFENDPDAYRSCRHPNTSIDSSTYTSVAENMSESYAFEALSYTWGNELGSAPIKIVNLWPGVGRASYKTQFCDSTSIPTA